MTRLKEWEKNALRSRLESQARFRKENWPCDPFSGEWVDAQLLPSWVLPVCLLAQERLSHHDRELKYQCYRRRGTAFNDCCVDRFWLKTWGEECKRNEPNAHEPE